jgi:type II secretory pathway component PulM
MQFVQSVELAPNHYLTLVDPAQAAINLATKEVPTYGTQTAQTVQAAQEGQQLAQQATPLNLRDDELALLLILLEATA